MPTPRVSAPATNRKLAYSVPEAAEVLGVHTNTVWHYVWSGEIPSRKLGRRVLIPASALEAWLDGGES